MVVDFTPGAAELKRRRRCGYVVEILPMDASDLNCQLSNGGLRS